MLAISEMLRSLGRVFSGRDETDTLPWTDAKMIAVGFVSCGVKTTFIFTWFHKRLLLRL